MEIVDAVRVEHGAVSDTYDNPDLELVLKVLETESEGTSDERRKVSRQPFFAIATIELTDPIGHLHQLKVHTRNANQWGVGFVSQAAIPVGHAVLLQIKGRDGADLRARGCIVRSRGSSRTVQARCFFTMSRRH